MRVDHERDMYINRLVQLYQTQNNKPPDNFLVSQWRLMPIQRLRVELEKYGKS